MKRLVNYFTFTDNSIFYFLNTKLNCRAFNKVMPWITELGGILFSLLLPILLIIFNQTSSRSIGFEILFAMSLAQVLVQILKKTLTRERPYNSLKDINTFDIVLKDYSFPSGHTTAAFITAIHLAIYVPQLAALFLIVAAAVGISRIYLAVHYPSDVLVGFIIAVGTSIISHSYLFSMFR